MTPGRGAESRAAPKASISIPESSARHTRPHCAAYDSALIRALASNVVPVSAGSTNSGAPPGKSASPSTRTHAPANSCAKIARSSATLCGLPVARTMVENIP